MQLVCKAKLIIKFTRNDCKQLSQTYARLHGSIKGEGNAENLFNFTLVEFTLKIFYIALTQFFSFLPENLSSESEDLEK